MPILNLIARGIIIIGWLFIIFVAAPLFFADCRSYWEEYRKSSTEGKSAEQVKKKQSNYNISEFRNINNLERWKWWQLIKK